MTVAPEAQLLLTATYFLHKPERYLLVFLVFLQKQIIYQDFTLQGDTAFLPYPFPQKMNMQNPESSHAKYHGVRKHWTHILLYLTIELKSTMTAMLRLTPS